MRSCLFFGELNVVLYSLLSHEVKRCSVGFCKSKGLCIGLVLRGHSFEKVVTRETYISVPFLGILPINVQLLLTKLVNSLHYLWNENLYCTMTFCLVQSCNPLQLIPHLHLGHRPLAMHEVSYSSADLSQILGCGNFLLQYSVGPRHIEDCVQACQTFVD